MHKIILNSSIMLLLLFNSNQASSQTNYSAEIKLLAQGSTQEELPFWMYSNQRGRIGTETNVLGLVAGEIVHRLASEAVIEIGVGGIIRDGFEKKLALDELYAEFRNEHFYITGGVKQKEELYNGLSATNENILWSLNARPLPGLEIGTTKPFFIFPGVGLEARWGEYLLEEDRHVPWARVHHKKLHLVLQPTEDWLIKIGIQHFAQWGGVSPDRGPQPEGFTDYLRIVTGRQGGEEALQGDIENSLGNHLGSWELEVLKSFEAGNISFIFNNIFEDGSGSRFANFPDGRYAVYWQDAVQEKIVNAIMYEFYFTRHQSHDVNRWGADNYLNHRMTYNSGWTYFEQVIGAPFFLYDENKDLIINNKFAAHHFGVGGDFGSRINPLPYRFLFSYVHNEGTYRTPLVPSGKKEDKFSLFLDSRLYNAAFDRYTSRLTLNLQFATDFNHLLNPIFGAGVSLKYEIF